MTDLITEQIAAAEARFDTLQKEINTLQQNVNDGNRQISARKEELVRLQGEYRALQSLQEKEVAGKKSKKKESKK